MFGMEILVALGLGLGLAAVAGVRAFLPLVLAALFAALGPFAGFGFVSSYLGVGGLTLRAVVGGGTGVVADRRGGRRWRGCRVQGRAQALGERSFVRRVHFVSEFDRGRRRLGRWHPGSLRAPGAGGARGVSVILLRSHQEAAGEEVRGPPHPRRLGVVGSLRRVPWRNVRSPSSRAGGRPRSRGASWPRRWPRLAPGPRWPTR